MTSTLVGDTRLGIQTHRHRSPPSGETLEARVVHDIEEIPPRVWDSFLDDDDLQASHRFVRVCQRSGVEDAEFRHIVLSRGGRPVATATLSSFELRLELLAGPRTRKLIEIARRGVPRLLRVRFVLGGLPVSFGQSCLRVAAGEDPAPLLARIAEEADRFAESVGARFICFKEMSAEEARVTDGLCDLGYIGAPSLPSCRLDLPFDDMDQLCNAMRAGYRRQLRHTFLEVQQQRLTVRRIVDWESVEGTLFELYEHVMDRAEYQMERLNRAFFRELRSEFGGRVPVLAVEDAEERVLAFALMLIGKRRSTFLIAGIRYAAPGALAAYRYAVTEAVAEALRERAAVLEMGQTSYGIKTRLGAQPTTRTIYIRHRAVSAHRVLRVLSGILFPNRRVPKRRVFSKG